ncbi:hypothetical protein AB1Y20_004753 [Prymnesium parvum]|uniref:Ionotropic glutamate receptor C-terminal domain-containing protein n=1 Tax=Prymnesium parvum TaxID=97485 RepID=A0AB34IXD4_PRYPA|mmetsp:Transcript_6448/g.15560  ORF Transcript_6448/g.15560 Transcript_6448/m.15560 type:complete len:675 (-) Transcript_6448:287-2311(-)
MQLMMAAALIMGASPDASWPHGTSACPCIDPWSYYGDSLQLNGHTPTAPSDSCAMTREGDKLCYTATYGSRGCDVYDMSATPECARTESKPAWCPAMWCFVDANNCDQPHGVSEYFSNSTPPFTFSYETCGYVNTFNAGSAMDQLRTFVASRPRKKLRIAFPLDDSSDGSTLIGIVPYRDGTPKIKPFKGVGGSNRSGSSLVFMDSIFATHGIPWEQVPVSAHSAALSPSSAYTACVYDVALGLADMCWGNFWPIQSRRLLTSFTAPFYTDHFHVVVRRGRREESFSEVLFKSFSPFTPMLWLSFMLALAYVGITLNWEADPERKLSRGERCISIPVWILKGFNAFGTGGEIKGVNIKTAGGWMTSVALGFSCLVMVTGYNAVVVSELVEQRTGRVQSLEEGISRGYRFCVHTVVQESLENTYPSLITVERAHGVSMMEAMDAGECDAAILHEDAWRSERTGNTEQCLTKLRLKATVASVHNAFPVRAEVEHIMSWAITRQLEKGQYEQLRVQARLNFTSRDRICAEASDTESVTQLGFAQLGGPILLMLLVATVSVIVTRHRIREERMQQLVNNMEDHIERKAPRWAKLNRAKDAVRRSIQGRRISSSPVRASSVTGTDDPRMGPSHVPKAAWVIRAYNPEPGNNRVAPASEDADTHHWDAVCPVQPHERGSD